MGKSERTFDVVTSELDSKKEELKVKRAELVTLEKENGLKMNKDHSENEKVGKKWAKIKATINSLAEERNTLAEEVKNLKPKKERAIRPTKYEYPEGMSKEDKKKFRTQARSQSAPKKEKAIKPEKVKNIDTIDTSTDGDEIKKKKKKVLIAQED